MLYDVYTREKLGGRAHVLRDEGTARCTGRGSPASDSLTKRT